MTRKELLDLMVKIKPDISDCPRHIGCLTFTFHSKSEFYEGFYQEDSGLWTFEITLCNTEDSLRG